MSNYSVLPNCFCGNQSGYIYAMQDDLDKPFVETPVTKLMGKQYLIYATENTGCQFH